MPIKHVDCLKQTIDTQDDFHLQIKGLMIAYLNQDDCYKELLNIQKSDEGSHKILQNVLFKIRLDKVGIDQEDKIVR